jgi:hypothetical protein
MHKPASDLEKYLAGEFADGKGLLIPLEARPEPKGQAETEACLLQRVLEPFMRKGS